MSLSLRSLKPLPAVMRGLLWLFTLALSYQAWAASPRLAIIIDDIGYNLSLGQRSAELPGNFTLSVLPFTPHGAELAELGHERGKEIMLHAPMSNERNLPLGKGGLTQGMTQDEFIGVLRADLASVPHVRGLNNHMGSLLTQQAQPMSWVMAELKARQLYFVDSRTSPKTRALDMAEQLGVPSRKRDVFLDDERQVDKIRAQLELALHKARLQGSAVAIGHPYPSTLKVLADIQPLLAAAGVQLVPASALMGHLTAAPWASGYCAAPPQFLWPRAWYPRDPFALPENLVQMASKGTNQAFSY